MDWWGFTVLGVIVALTLGYVWGYSDRGRKWK